MINEQCDLNNNSILFTNTNNDNDISYTRYVTEDTNLQVLCTPQPINLNNFDKSFNVHDYECEFLLLKYITETNEHKSQLLKENEMLLNHKPLNLPYQYNAVSINNNNGLSNNYINASYITTTFNHMFIAAENPLTEITINDFWRVILTQKITFIICISYTLSENNKTFTQYWPDNINIKQAEFNDGNNMYYKINLKEEFNINKDKVNNMHSGTCIKRILEITPKDNDNVLLTITHVHLNCWENKSLPIQQMGFQLIVDLINQIDTHFTNTTTPILIHCSDGTGRTGTFIAIYNIISYLNLQKNNQIKQPVYNVFNIVRKLREERYGMVSEMHQYKYIYDFCKMWLKNYYM